MKERKCLECGDLLRGRSDQKFCSDQCRNTYNNRKFGDANNLIRQINRILKKNRAILAELNPGDKTTLFGVEMVKAGFNFDYYTNTLTTRAGRTYYFCYDLGYAELEGTKYLIVRKADY